MSLFGRRNTPAAEADTVEIIAAETSVVVDRVAELEAKLAERDARIAAAEATLGRALKRHHRHGPFVDDLLDIRLALRPPGRA